MLKCHTRHVDVTGVQLSCVQSNSCGPTIGWSRSAVATCHAVQWRWDVLRPGEGKKDVGDPRMQWSLSTFHFAWPCDVGHRVSRICLISIFSASVDRWHFSATLTPVFLLCIALTDHTQRHNHSTIFLLTDGRAEKKFNDASTQLWTVSTQQ